MATASNTENAPQLTGADQFDFAAIKEMLKLECLAECKAKPVFEWPIQRLEHLSILESQRFVFDSVRFSAKLSLMVRCNSSWDLTVTFVDIFEAQDEWKKSGSSSASEGSFYLVVKCKYDFVSRPLDEEELCQQIIVFGGGNRKASLSWSYSHNNRFVRSILLKVYVVSAAIPNFFGIRNNNMIVGKIEKFGEARKGERYVNYYNKQPCFLFGSARQRMTLMFSSTRISSNGGGWGLKAVLKIVNERESLVNYTRNVVTFTVFSQRKEEANDLIYKSVVFRRGKEFNYEMTLDYFEELDKMLENDTLYYKVVLNDEL